MSKKQNVYCICLCFIWMLVFSLVFVNANSYAGEGPETNKLTDVPKGFKLVSIDDECTHPDPCAAQKAEIAKLKAEIARLKAENRRLAEEEPDCPVCKKEEPKEPKTVYKYVEHTKEVEKKVPFEVEKVVAAKNVFRIMGALGEDGLETSANEGDEYARDAETYYSALGGLGYTRFFDNNFGLGIFGMVGGVSRMVGISGEWAW